MPQPVTHGAQMQCDKGTAPSQIKVTSQNHAAINGKLQATNMELVAEENIPSFGKCTVTRSQCISHATRWRNTTSFAAIDGMEELTTASTCKCSLGGTISFIAETNNTFVDNIEKATTCANNTSNTERPGAVTKQEVSDRAVISVIVIGAVLITLLIFLAVFL